MVQPKYNPNQALERTKLLMGYDLSKTLTENKSNILKEDAATIAAQIRKEINASFSDEQKIVDAFKSLNNANEVKELLSKYKTTYNKDLGRDLIEALQSWRDKTEIEEIRKHLEGHGVKFYLGPATGEKDTRIKEFKFEFTNQKNGGGGGGGSKTQKYPNKGQQYPECTGGIYTKGCWSSQVLKVQECLKISPAYGNFGPKTEAELKAKFSDKEFYKQFTDKDIPTICGTVQPQPTQTANSTNPPANDSSAAPNQTARPEVSAPQQISSVNSSGVKGSSNIVNPKIPYSSVQQAGKDYQKAFNDLKKKYPEYTTKQINSLLGTVNEPFVNRGFYGNNPPT